MSAAFGHSPKRVLFLTPQLPYPPEQGTALRNYNLIAQVARSHTVGLLSFTQRLPSSAELEHLQGFCDLIMTVPAPARTLLEPAGALAIATSLREPTTFGRIDLAAIAAVASEHLARPEEADRNLQLAVRLAHARGTVAPFVLLPRVDVEALVARDREAEELLAPVLASTSTSIELVDAVRLSARERLVLAELARSGSASEIAERLFVSVNTIKSQLRSIYRKLDVASREEALTEAARLGFDLDARD